jgi:hypothetical protein
MVEHASNPNIQEAEAEASTTGSQSSKTLYSPPQKKHTHWIFKLFVKEDVFQPSSNILLFLPS